MKRSVIIFTILLVVVGASSWWFFSGEKKTGTSKQTQQQDSAAATMYVCPMHPQITSEKPGTCPICGMDLVLVQDQDQEQEDPETHAAHAAADSEMTTDAPADQANQADVPKGHVGFELSLNKQQMIGIKLGRAELKPLFKSIRAPGRIAFDPELYTAQSEYLEALRQWQQIKNSPLADVRENTRQMIRSSKIRLKVLGLSDEQTANLAKRGSQSEGLLVSGKGQDNWIYADIFEVDLPYLKKGLSAQITANFLQGKTLAGEVISIDQVIDPDTRTAKVRIQLNENHPSIRPESYVNITIFAPVGEHLAVPLEAIMDTGRETYVFVKKGEGKFEPRVVTVLLETDKEAAIAAGVKPSEEVVIGGNFMLDSESRLKSVIQGAGSASSAHNH